MHKDVGLPLWNAMTLCGLGVITARKWGTTPPHHAVENTIAFAHVAHTKKRKVIDDDPSEEEYEFSDLDTSDDHKPAARK